MTSTTVYERLEDHEVEHVRRYRRELWRARAAVDTSGAGSQVREAVGSYVEAWADGLGLDEVASVALSGVRVGDLSPEKRYHLVGLLSEEAA